MEKTAIEDHGFCLSETTLIMVSWVAFATGMYFVHAPLWGFIFLAISRVLP